MRIMGHKKLLKWKWKTKIDKFKIQNLRTLFLRIQIIKTYFNTWIFRNFRAITKQETQCNKFYFVITKLGLKIPSLLFRNPPMFWSQREKYIWSCMPKCFHCRRASTPRRGLDMCSSRNDHSNRKNKILLSNNFMFLTSKFGMLTFATT